MGFLVGNDFIPHLPHLHIATDALPTIWATYKDVLPSLGGYLNDKGDINLYRLETFLKALAEVKFLLVHYPKTTPPKFVGLAACTIPIELVYQPLELCTTTNN